MAAPLLCSARRQLAPPTGVLPQHELVSVGICERGQKTVRDALDLSNRNALATKRLDLLLDAEKEDKNFDLSDRLAPIFMNLIAIVSCTSLALFVIGALKAARAFAFFSLLR